MYLYWLYTCSEGRGKCTTAQQILMPTCQIRQRVKNPNTCSHLRQKWPHPSLIFAYSQGRSCPRFLPNIHSSIDCQCRSVRRPWHIEDDLSIFNENYLILLFQYTFSLCKYILFYIQRYKNSHEFWYGPIRRVKLIRFSSFRIILRVYLKKNILNYNNRFI